MPSMVDRPIKEAKFVLRQLATKRRTSLTERERAVKSKQIAQRLLALPEVSQAKTVSIYCSFGSEVDTHALIEQLVREGKTVCLPVVDFDLKSMSMYAFKSFAELKTSSFGFPEPVRETHVRVPDSRIDVLITPGLAFDEQGRRLGFGMAFYDKFISHLPKRVPLLALAFECQLFAEVPVTQKDMRVEKIVTEERVIMASS
ncbi:MAG: 5-formyltetrahydrofolate cyclo-ligase [Candidatus Diapherotrites archaeon]|uniref:5-formyltetrahydrofolate cyclo-ligase n=1 Tax=Candidatus Iainarchaeum sp. TaxID=3101447 RepID=A0A8T4L6C8_9ARCH|nr:5-formyltetrahydrofolate cyclo-ligase [Candidatus Diapherotrites archaeon]